jgi:hypothetical protein
MLWIVNTVRISYKAPDAVKHIEVHRHKSGLPIVAVKDFGAETDVLEHSRMALEKKAKRSASVEEAVQPVPLEVVLVVDKVALYAVYGGFVHATVLVAPAQRHVRSRLQSAWRSCITAGMFSYSGMTTRQACMRLRTAVVSEPATSASPPDLMKRNGLAGRKQNFHVVPPWSQWKFAL